MSIKFDFVHDCDDMKCAEINTFTVKSFNSFKMCIFLDHLTIWKKNYCNLFELIVLLLSNIAK